MIKEWVSNSGNKYYEAGICMFSLNDIFHWKPYKALLRRCGHMCVTPLTIDCCECTPEKDVTWSSCEVCSIRIQDDTIH